MRFDIRLIKSRYVVNTAGRSIILYLFFPSIYMFLSGVKIEKWNVLPVLARGAAAGVRPWREAAACLSERYWHLVSGVIPLPAEAAQTAAPSAHLVSAFGRPLSRCCLDGSSFHGSNRWAWSCCCHCCPDAGGKRASERLMCVDFLSEWTRTSITVDASAAIAGLNNFFCQQWWRKTRQQAHILIQSECVCVWVWSETWGNALRDVVNWNLLDKQKQTTKPTIVRQDDVGADVHAMRALLTVIRAVTARVI